MRRESVKRTVAIGVALVVVASALWIASAPSAAGTPATAPRSTTAVTSTLPTEPENAGAAMAHTALAAVAAAHLTSRVVSVPRPSATREELAESAAVGHVTPLYSAAPAPIGVADFGLSAGAGGRVVPSIVNTTSVRGQLDMNGPGIHGLDLADSNPDAFGIQLNSVQSNVTLFGQSGYSFWTQDIALYYPATDTLYLDSNVWNWSGGPLTPNVFYAHGPLGIQVDESFYYAFDGPFTVTEPFNLTFFLNSSLVDGRDAVSFDADISSAAGTINAPWDYAVFNSTAPGAPRLHHPSNYEANGFQYNPIGLTDDFEMIVGGPNGGSQSDLTSADATIGLAYWSNSAHGYRSVPSAYSYGGETGETVIGANTAWSNAPGGPAGETNYGVLNTGPSLCTGLWNAGGPEGVVPLHLDLSPSNAFVLVSPVANAFDYKGFEYAPTLTTSTLMLSPGTYVYTLELSGYAPKTGTISLPAGSPGGVSLAATLSPAPRLGIYTPLFAWANDQLPAISSGGFGTALQPYQLMNHQSAPIGSFFGVLNDYGYPVFPGVLLVGTTSYVNLENAATFLTEFSNFGLPEYTNDLPLWFAAVTHVAILNDHHISGWFGSEVYGPGYWTPFDAVFYNSNDDLVAGNTFDVTGGGGLLLFGGGNNTIWGNRFIEENASAPSIAPIPFGDGVGIQIAESGDLIYNNAVYTPTTAWQLIFNFYSGNYELFDNTWNISVQSEWVVHTAVGFPYTFLVGSIVGTSWQGGNYWWDYGIFNPYNGAYNPFGELPYTENGVTPIGNSPFIYPGGDYAPLVPGSPPP
jgi:thermopsin